MSWTNLCFQSICQVRYEGWDLTMLNHNYQLLLPCDLGISDTFQVLAQRVVTICFYYLFDVCVPVNFTMPTK